MLTEESFLLEIVAQPDDHATRLVFADWLDEHDQCERAEFIRAQVELATPQEDSPRRRSVAFRARVLLEEHEDTWIEPLRRHIHRWQFARGFVERLELTGSALKEKGEELFAAVPLRRLWV